MLVIIFSNPNNFNIPSSDALKGFKFVRVVILGLMCCDFCGNLKKHSLEYKL